MVNILARRTNFNLFNLHLLNVPYAVYNDLSAGYFKFLFNYPVNFTRIYTMQDTQLAVLYCSKLHFFIIFKVFNKTFFNIIPKRMEKLIYLHLLDVSYTGYNDFRSACRLF